MSVGSVGKWLSMGMLVASLGAVGCGDDDEKTTDAGGGTPDAGGEEDAGGGEEDAGGSMDGGTDGGGSEDSGPQPVMCGGKACSSWPTAAITFPAGCALNALDAEVCGIDSRPVFGADAGFTFLEIHAPGIDSPSCGAFIDNLDLLEDGGLAPADAGTRGNMKQDRFINLQGVGAVRISTPGCCTPKGYCSGNSDMGESTLPGSTMSMTSNGGFGCMQADAFLRSIPEAARRRCDPATGMILPATTGDAGSDAGAGDAGDAGDGG